jgi:hypothetical protein
MAAAFVLFTRKLLLLVIVLSFSSCLFPLTSVYSRTEGEYLADPGFISLFLFWRGFQTGPEMLYFNNGALLDPLFRLFRLSLHDFLRAG